MTTNIIAFPTATKTAFTDAEQAALTACAGSLPGRITTRFAIDVDGEQTCAFMPRRGLDAVALVSIEKGEMTLWDGRGDGLWACQLEAIVTTRDIRVIVAAIADHWA